MSELWKKFWQCHKNFQDEKLKVKGKPIADNNRSFKNRILRRAKSLSRKYERKSGSIEAAGDRDILKSPNE